MNAEFERAQALHKAYTTPDAAYRPEKLLLHLYEELGEVGRALSGENQSGHGVSDELLQVACRALAWHEAMNR